MSTAAFAGFNGQIFLSTDGSDGPYTPVGEVRDGTLTVNQEEIDATSYDSVGWMEYIVGLKSWEMSTEALYLSANDPGQLALWKTLKAGSKAWWRFLPKTGENRRGFQGAGFVTNYEVNVPVDDVVSLSISIRGTGILKTYKTPAG